MRGEPRAAPVLVVPSHRFRRARLAGVWVASSGLAFFSLIAAEARHSRLDEWPRGAFAYVFAISIPVVSAVGLVLAALRGGERLAPESRRVWVGAAVAACTITLPAYHVSG